MARACCVAVEGELGYVPGVEGEDAERHPGSAQYTTAGEARDFVRLTGVDCLAVSVGTVHGRMQGKPRLDWGRLKEINAAVGVPLVIHGGTGLANEQFRKLATLGVAKINYYTALADAADEAIRAAEVLACCRPWLIVEHVVVYNAPQVDEARLRAVMIESQRQLAAIPGVREVAVGSASDKSARYRYCWGTHPRLSRRSAPGFARPARYRRTHRAVAPHQGLSLH